MNNQLEKPKLFIGKYFKNNVLITDIRYAAGYPEYFEPYYSLFTKTKDGVEKWLINLPEKDFYEGNKIFSD